MSARKPFVAAISGIKNSGKTTFLEHLVPVLRARGLRVAVIKHDGHDFTPDVPGTDSFRMRQAGADGVAVYSGHQWMVVRPQPGSLEALIGQFADCDLVLLEGQKASPYPKIELVRGTVSHESVCAPETLLGPCHGYPGKGGRRGDHRAGRLRPGGGDPAARNAAVTHTEQKIPLCSDETAKGDLCVCVGNCGQGCSCASSQWAMSAMTSCRLSSISSSWRAPG